MYRTTLLLASLSLLSACGGGSNSSSETPSGKSTTPATPTLNTLSLVAKYKDACGNETSASDAALLIHDSDYSNKDIIYADGNGKITYQTDSLTQTVSIVMRGRNEVSGVKPVILTTFIDYPIKDMGNYYEYTDATDACDCQSFNLKVNVPARANDRADGRLSGVDDDGQVSNNLGSTEFTGLLSCKAPSEPWPLVSVIMNFSNPEESFAALVSDISTADEVNAELRGTHVDITTNDDSATRQVSTTINGIPHLRNYAFNNSGAVYGFPGSSPDYYSVSTYTFDFLNDYLEADDVLFLISANERTKVLNKTFDLPLPDIDYNSLFDIIISDSGQYDLSQIDNMDSVYVEISAFVDDEVILYWTLIAPTSGQVPEIENIDMTAFISDDTLDVSVNKIEMSASIIGYSGINGYQDYINNLNEQTNDNGDQEKWSRSEFALLEITINENILNSSASKVSTVIQEHLLNRGSYKLSNKAASKTTNDISRLVTK